MSGGGRGRGGGSPGGRPGVSRRNQGGAITFSARELRDLAAAWLALGFAFALFLDQSLLTAILGGSVNTAALVRIMALSLSTVGVGFLLHELAHKVVAVRFGQVAAFRADYGMLFLAIMAAMAGFLFAAPGAVVHRGRITKRQNGLIALAGPVTNLGLAVLFVVPVLSGQSFVAEIGVMGVRINLLLAGFNMIPFGPLDGRKVLTWSKLVYAAVAIPSVALAAGALFLF